MHTEILKIDNINVDQDKIEFAAKILKNGGTVAFPTETVYGLGANGLSEKAVEKIFAAKGRPSDNPLIIHISRLEEVEQFALDISPKLDLLAQKFWPGPLTIILNKKNNIPDVTTGGLNTVAIRIPNDEIALELIGRANVPVAAPSANISGSPSPTCAEHVIKDLYGRVDAIIDGGCSKVGVESTVLDLTSEIPKILRPGGITYEQLTSVVGEVLLDPSLLGKVNIVKPLCPGMKYTHYSPKAEVIIVEGKPCNVIEKINDLCRKYEENGQKVGIMATNSTKDYYKKGQVISLGNTDDLNQIASQLFTVLREFDNINVDIILSESVENKGIGLAIMNRLNKAAGYNIIKV